MIIHNLKSQTELSGYYIVFKGSASSETSNLRGVSHLLEHMLCSQMMDLIEETDKYCVNFNAMTGDDYVIFYLTGLDEYVCRFRDEIYHRLTTPITFTQEELEKDRKIVLQELEQGKSNLHRYSMQLFRRAMFDYYGPSGDPDVVASVTLAEVQERYEKQFSEPYMTIFVSNSVPEDTTEGAYGYSVDPVNFLTGHPDPIIPELPNKGSYFAYSQPIPDSEEPLSEMICYMLSGNLNKPLYRRLRTDLGLCYAVGIFPQLLVGHYANLLQAQISPDKFDEVTGEVADILEKGEFLTREEFDQTLRYFKIQRRLAEANRQEDIWHLLYNTINSADNLSGITYEAICEHYDKYFRHYLTSFTRAVSPVAASETTTSEE